METNCLLSSRSWPARPRDSEQLARVRLIELRAVENNYIATARNRVAGGCRVVSAAWVACGVVLFAKQPRLVTIVMRVFFWGGGDCLECFIENKHTEIHNQFVRLASYPPRVQTRIQTRTNPPTSQCKNYNLFVFHVLHASLDLDCLLYGHPLFPLVPFCLQYARKSYNMLA